MQRRGELVDQLGGAKRRLDAVGRAQPAHELAELHAGRSPACTSGRIGRVGDDRHARQQRRLEVLAEDGPDGRASPPRRWACAPPAYSSHDHVGGEVAGQDDDRVLEVDRRGPRRRASMPLSNTW